MVILSPIKMLYYSFTCVAYLDKDDDNVEEPRILTINEGLLYKHVI